MSFRTLALIAGALTALVPSWPVPAQQAAPGPPQSFFSELRWRNIGPHRASRTVAAVGHRGQPHTFYMAQVNGGVWKTTDAGRTWKPIFDDQSTGSIGSIVVAPSDPNIVYVGSGEGLHRPDLSTGEGMFKSTDAGNTWAHIGLRDAQQIPRIDVDPRDPNRLFVAALGHPYGPNEERGIFRSTNGGRSFEKVLYKDENTGGNDVDVDPSDSNVVYATMWEERQGPWENAVWAGTGGGIFKSTDGGTTWRPLTKGLPQVIQANLAISPANPRRIFATVASASEPGMLDQVRGAGGMYRSDDAGESWRLITDDTRPTGRIGGGDLPMPLPDPKNPEVVISASTVSWKSTDGGVTWAPFKGAPGGEDYQNGWINPDHPNIMIFGVDQGAVVTLNGGETWSSWYNQSTAQMYHVTADNAFPYRVCSGQQESGSACVSSRGNYGAISLRDWTPVGVDEYGYVAPDPLDPDIVYGGRNVTRYDRRTGQVSTVGPIGGRGGTGGPQGPFRTVRTMPVVFSEVDKRALFFANNHLWKTVNGGDRWQQISPDLTRASWETPRSVGKYAGLPGAQPSRRGVIYTIAPSYQEVNRIWVGTDDGLIHVTADAGKTWQDITPPAVDAWAKVSLIDAGRFDPLTAYAAINTLRLDDLRPHIFRTHDGGRTWTEIVNGIPAGETVNAVREDPKRKGLLFAGTERAVYVSFNDGAKWQSLRLNMGVTSVRDLIVKDDDLVSATHGRGFWILDDITPLRQIQGPLPGANDSVVLCKPTTAWRVRWNTSTDMPWPAEEPTGENPPDGAIINYYLPSAAAGEVILEITRADGRLVRRYSSTDPVTPVPEARTAPVPLYWLRAPKALSTAPGLHRFVWDIHHQPLPNPPGGGAGGGRGGGLPIQAIPYNTAPAPTTPWVAPGTYTMTLSVNGKRYSQPIEVKQDPRVKTPAVSMRQVYDWTNSMYFGAADAHAAALEAAELRGRVVELRASAPAS
nr:glycoside hydrolase [Acidobacteriota bacterium]